MRKLLHISILAAALALAAPAASQAKTFCVNAGSACPAGGLDAGGQLQGAIAGAEASPGPDIVLLGATPSPYVGPFSVNATVATPEPIAIVGVGGRPVITAPEASPQAIFMRKASARRIEVRRDLTTALNSAGIMLSDASLDDVVVTSEEGHPTRSGVVAFGPATIENTTIDVTGVSTVPSGIAVVSGGSLRADRVTAKAPGAALFVRGGGSVGMTRSRLIGRTRGVNIAGGDLQLARTVVNAPNRDDGEQGIVAVGTRLALDHVTIAAGAAAPADAAGLSLGSNSFREGDARLESVVLAGFGQNLRRGPTTTVTASRSVWDDDADDPGILVESGNVHVAPALDGDLRPLPGSPMVDLDDLSTPSLYEDLLGAPALDGDGDGVVRPDAGALELRPQPPAPPVDPPAPPVDPPPAPPAPAPPAPAPPRPPADRTAPSLSALKVTTNLTLQLKVSEAATLRIVATRGKRSATLIRGVRAGRRKLALLADLRKRRLLGSGKVTLKVVATDAAGNRSRTAALRVRPRR